MALASGAGAPAAGSRQLDALETRLLAMVSSHLREADKIAAFTAKNMEARIGAVEQRQLQLERRVSELVGALAAGAPNENVAAPPPHVQRAAGGRHQPHADGDEARQLLLAEQAAEALERRLETQAAKRDGYGCGDGRAARGEASPTKRGSAAVVGSGDTALLAVQELEALVHSEMKSIQRRFSMLQDMVDERALLPLRDFEQRLREQDQKVKQLTCAGQECSSRVEEHEFRLGVARTKLEVHDQKISRLEALRWQRSGSELDRPVVGSSGGGTPKSAAGSRAAGADPMGLLGNGCH